MSNKSIESSLIHFLSKKCFSNDYDELAAHFSRLTNKEIQGRKILFMSRGERYAKKWLLDEMIKESSKNGWLPQSQNEWVGVGWSVTGDRAAFNKNKIIVFEKFSSLTAFNAKELENLHNKK